MKKFVLYCIFGCTFFTSGLQAQLSPGDLTDAHAELEGMANCTQCHTLGDKVANEKCLACHTEVQIRLDQRRGYHNSKEVKGKDCFTCHSEHHGRKFDMIRFDEEKFNHNLAGYELTGAHTKIDCRQCHIPDFIEDKELKKRKDTYFGLVSDCVSCHEDYHQRTLSFDCVNCHSTNTFSPAENFNHNQTQYPLVGQHREVECIECHQKETRNAKEFQHFSDLEFANCNSCHEDVHQNKLGTNCTQCHTEQSFNSWSKINQFNHRQTNFPLKGAHQHIDCAACHNTKTTPLAIFQDRLGIKTNDCVTCHEDVHDNKFGQNCAECHNEESFLSVNMDGFNHNLTNFELKGKHQTVDCRECHTESLTEPLPHNECAACHSDYHESEFVINNASPDCVECHTEDGFEESLFSIADHQETKFPLEGAHLATPCFACHLNEEKWHFRNIGERCVDCHEDIHEGYIAVEFYPNQDCEKCHITDDWVTNLFDHNQTDFELLGKHSETKCMDCHLTETAAENRYEGFVNTSTECVSCHENVHNDQFAQNGITDCARCHGFENWGIEDFNHDNTAFKLEGRHAEIDCEACHKRIESEGNVVVQYKFNNFECIYCHQ